MFAKPLVGQIVTVTTQYSDGKSYTYSNLPVLKSERFDAPDSFRIPAINEPYITHREISLSVVVGLNVNGEAEHSVTVDPSVKVFTVIGSKGDEYTITRMGNRMTCTCPGFAYRKWCRHTTAAETVE